MEGSVLQPPPPPCLAQLCDLPDGGSGCNGATESTRRWTGERRDPVRWGLLLMGEVRLRDGDGGGIRLLLLALVGDGAGSRCFFSLLLEGMIRTDEVRFHHSQKQL